MGLRLCHWASARSALRALGEQTLCQLALPQALHIAEDHEQKEHHAIGGRDRDEGFPACSRPSRAAHGHSVACQDSLSFASEGKWMASILLDTGMDQDSPNVCVLVL